MARSLTRLRWSEDHPGIFRASLGEVQIGTVMDLGERGWGWKIDGVRTRYYTKGGGNMPGYHGPRYGSREAARRALVRSWRRWCQLAGLVR